MAGDFAKYGTLFVIVASTCCRIEVLSKVLHMIVLHIAEYKSLLNGSMYLVINTLVHRFLPVYERRLPTQFPDEKESLLHPNALFKVSAVFSETLLQMIGSKVPQIPACCLDWV